MAIVTLVFSVFLVGLGAFGLIHSIRESIRAMSSRRWPTSEAVVTSSVVIERRGGRGRRTFEPIVEYRYMFRGQTYVGQRLAFGDVSSRNREEAKRIAERFAVGTQWEVRVNERRPDLAVLHVGPIRRVWLAIVVFAGVTTCAIVAFIDAL